MPQVYDALQAVVMELEDHYRDVQDFEFTVERGSLFLLQTRSAKRSAQAAIRVAVEMAEEGRISKEEAILRVNPSSLHEITSPQLDLTADDSKPIARGLAASPGSAVGRLALTAQRAVALAGKRKEFPVILVRKETSAEDIHGMDAAVGFITANGGATSHAAVVARDMGKYCITGASDLEVDETHGILRIGEKEFREGDWLSIDGGSGSIFAGELPLKPGQLDNPWLKKMLLWSRREIGSSVRANADTPDDAECARNHDATGIGLCRTEHMFFAPGRLSLMRALDTYLELGILKDDPFITVDREGVGQLMRLAIQNARQSNPSIKVGVCGEHGGDPRSIEFFHSLGVDYVSASPARIPVAQLALAQVHLRALAEGRIC